MTIHYFFIILAPIFVLFTSLARIGFSLKISHYRILRYVLLFTSYTFVGFVLFTLHLSFSLSVCVYNISPILSKRPLTLFSSHSLSPCECVVVYIRGHDAVFLRETGTSFPSHLGELFFHPTSWHFLLLHITYMLTFPFFNNHLLIIYLSLVQSSFSSSFLFSLSLKFFVER